MLHIKGKEYQTELRGSSPQTAEMIKAGVFSAFTGNKLVHTEIIKLFNYFIFRGLEEA
jgi:hypothetical protein